MFQTRFDAKARPTTLKDEKRLAAYRVEVARVIRERDAAKPEFSLAYVHDDVLRAVRTVTKRFAGVRHVIVLGIGGSSLGVEAVHSALKNSATAPVLTVLDMITPSALTALEETLLSIKKVKQLAVCVMSKSGTTTETLANASVLLRMLEGRFGAAVHEQVLYVGDPGTPLAKVAKKLGAEYISMPTVIGGRYSVGTEVGLIPLALLGHDIEAFAQGFVSASEPGTEEGTAASAVHLFSYVKAGYRHYNFFAFEARLYKLGCWYRQLAAESLGKETDKAGKPVKLGFLPTISTPVELHSVGQLYLSNFPGVYTEFVSIDDNSVDYKIGPTKLAPQLAKFTLEQVGAALYGGVVGAYQERSLPYRATVLSENLPYSLGYYMASAMRETMYLAHLMNVSAFDQPHVELYKIKTRELLGL
ncbi:hypothetical protein K2Q16_01940 [Patescibacteria group bacterium]|nr:hypothetical protein [Patescibacteria group bacterium]